MENTLEPRLSCEREPGFEASYIENRGKFSIQGSSPHMLAIRIINVPHDVLVVMLTCTLDF